MPRLVRFPKRPLVLLLAFASVLYALFSLFSLFSSSSPSPSPAPLPPGFHQPDALTIIHNPPPTPLPPTLAKRVLPKKATKARKQLQHNQQPLQLSERPTRPGSGPCRVPAWYSAYLANPVTSSAAATALLASYTDKNNNNSTMSAEATDITVLPFYYRASRTPEEDDITITTLVTPNRFHVFARLAAAYEGPISATIHLPHPPSPSTLSALHTLYLSTPSLQSHADIHLVLSPARAFNTWRNVARAFARTKTVMLLDVDFFPCTDFRGSVRGSMEAQRLLREGEALVIPALEFANQKDGLDARRFPRSKAAVLPLLTASPPLIGAFHAAWSLGHSATNYTRFAAAAPGEIYRVPHTAYTHGYEPYVIFRTDAAGGAPWCDERFVGYGSNKAACLFELYLSGRGFFVLSDDFLVHQSHAYAEDTRRSERKINKKLYTAFREEACLNYLTHFIDTAQLGQSRSHNARIECAKYGRVAKRMANAVALKRLQDP